MNVFLTYLIIGFLASSPTEEKKVTRKISGTITTSGSYCGGVAPSNEMLQDAQAKRPMSGFMVYVKKGDENKLSSCIVDSTCTDAKGSYSFDLRPGKYVLLQKEQLNKDVYKTYEASKFLQVDADCMKLWWEKGLSNITVENENIDNLNFHFQKRCFVPLSIPCLRYSGPYPP
jgi:hypothetical protein